jgi:integrase
MTDSAVLDSAGRRRSPATLPGFHSGRPPRNKGMLYPADAPPVEEIVCVMRHASEDPHGWRLRAMIVMPWRGGLRVKEALALSERDLDPERGSVLVRCGKGGRRREVGMDLWGWENPRPWLSARLELPAGPLLRHRRSHPRSTVVGCCRTHRVSPPRLRSGSEETLRSPPAATRARR